VDPDPSDDVLILAERFQLGIPLLGMDGRTIPLRDAMGRPYGPIEAALLLVESALDLMDPDVADAFLDDTIDRAIAVEDAAIGAGFRGLDLDKRITGVFVSAAVRADLIARQGAASPSDLNRATLGWYQVQHLRRATLLAASPVGRTA
jgi:hypothetical protein